MTTGCMFKILLKGKDMPNGRETQVANSGKDAIKAFEALKAYWLEAQQIK